MTQRLHPTVKALRRVQLRYERAEDRVTLLRDERDQEIRAAIGEGMTHAQIYRALDGAISRARIGQIEQGRR